MHLLVSFDRQGLPAYLVLYPCSAHLHVAQVEVGHRLAVPLVEHGVPGQLVVTGDEMNCHL